MHQGHFLLSAAARSLSVQEVFALSESQAFEWLLDDASMPKVVAHSASPLPNSLILRNVTDAT
jgi:hypothetical protein